LGINNKTLIRILKIIKDHEPITRTEIARLAKLSKTMITFHVNKLLNSELISEDKKSKKNIKLRITDEKYYIIGVDARADSIKVGLLNLRTQLIAENSLKIDYAKVIIEPNILLDKAELLIREIYEKNKTKIFKIIGIGFSFISSINYNTNKISVLGDRLNWSYYKKRIEEKFDCPVFIGNDANLLALVEKYHGYGKNIDDFIFLRVGYHGRGSGIISNGQLVKGADGFAGEIGHVALKEDDKNCFCGNKGCLASYISEHYIIQSGMELAKNGKSKYLLKVLRERGNIELRDIRDAIIHGDSDCIEIIRSFSKDISIPIAFLVSMLNPEVIIIGGKVTTIFSEILLNEIKKNVLHMAYPPSASRVKIEFSKIKKNKSLIGTGILTIYELLSDSKKFMDSIKKK